MSNTNAAAHDSAKARNSGTARADSVEAFLQGAYDLHMHTAPDLVERSLDDVDAATEAARAGMAGILLKNHFGSTADRARVAQRVSGFPVFGSLVLGHAVGGWNPAAVAIAIEAGIKTLWMPTLDAVHFRDQGSVPLLARLGGSERPGLRFELNAETNEILSLCADADIVVASGHLSWPETRHLFRTAREAGVRRFVITHPHADFAAVPEEELVELRDEGAYVELVWNVCTSSMANPTPPSLLAEFLLEHGSSNCYIASDGGQLNNPRPVQMLRDFIRSLKRHGIADEDLIDLTVTTPRDLLFPTEEVKVRPRPR